MLLYIKKKSQHDADEKMLRRLGGKHEVLYSNKTEDLRKRIFISEKSKLPQTKKRAIEHIVFDLNYMLEPNDGNFLAMLGQLKNERPDVQVTFFYLLDYEYLLSNAVEQILIMGYTQFLKAENDSDFLKKLNAFLVDITGFSNDGKRGRCITVGVLGGCRRIGTTIQSMQILMFLQQTGFRVGLIQWHNEPELQGYVDIVPGSKFLTESEFVVAGYRFYGQQDLKTALNDNDFLIFDFGNIEKIDERSIALFQEKDIRIAVLGAKISEVRNFSAMFGLDTNRDMKYIYSFILPADRGSVKSQMGDRRNDTYFAEYTPDYFTFGGQDDMYSKMLNVQVPQQPAQRKLIEKAKGHFGNIGSKQIWTSSRNDSKSTLG